MSEQTARLALPIILPAQAQKHVTHNEALQKLDLVVQLTLEAFDALTPPANPQDGQIWALGAIPSGVWAGQAGRLAAYMHNQWEFVTPSTGWIGCAGSVLRVFDGTDWVAPQLDGLQNLPGLGVNTSFDATNRLAVAANATLLSHEGAGHQLKINKAVAADTASLLFQTNWSGRAEMGTTGNDDFSIKVSSDGSDWREALSANAVTGRLSAPNGMTVTGNIMGSAVTQSANDPTPGRLLRVGDFGLGAATVNNPDCNTAVVTGFYTVGGATANTPGGVGPSGSALQVLRFGDGNVMQMFYRRGGGADVQLYVRHQRIGIWQDWRRLLNVADISGTVSQSAGVPTGAIIQRGSNSNGEFVRLADGMQICTARRVLTVTTNLIPSVIFPAAFAGASVVLPFPDGNTNDWNDLSDRFLQVRQRDIGGNGTRFILSSAPAGGNFVLKYTAIGRWF